MKDLSIFPLAAAVLCVNCENVSDHSGPNCPSCGSPSLLNMARLLGQLVPGGEEIRQLPMECGHA